MMPAALPDKARRSRITAACAVCRAKRQKCSGSKPTCDQCLSHNEQCWWSDQKKRGPAKDYLRSLQDRLQDTERLLLGLLDQTSDEQLRNALENETAPPSHHTWTTSLSGQEYWSRFPLNRMTSVRQWQRERSIGQPAQAPSEASIPREHTADYLQPPTVLDPLLSSSSTSPLHRTLQPAPIATMGNEQRLIQSSPPRGQQRKGSLERRYSDETRDVAKTLFSISSNGESLKRKHDPSDYNSYQDPTMAAHSSQAPEEPPAKFPKHLFW